MKAQINVVGIGPGHRDWLLPISQKILAASDVIIGGRRQLEEVADLARTTRLLEGNYSETASWILENAGNLNISVAVSGDTGFYSLLSYLKKNLPGVRLNVFPGIGSLQYFFGRLGLGWENARLLSAHGRELALESMTADTLAGILTDGVMTPGAIAAELVRLGKGELWMAVGENLSYESEAITIGPVTEIQHQTFEPLNAVLIIPAEQATLLREEKAHEQ